MEFSDQIYFSYLLKGDLPGGMNYVRQFPEQAELYDRYINIFERERYIDYEVDVRLGGILTMYQKYYRDAFYLRIGRENAADKLKAGLAEYLGVADEGMELDDMEQNQVAKAFQDRGLYFMGGRTSGYYGPYIWRTTESKTYEVELPEGIQTYTINMLEGFIFKGWADYLSFGRVGTGGWTGRDGIINCVKSSYDTDSEDFKVSLLKHEAQHARDLKAEPSMSSEELEYRAKLVELIYSGERNLLERFARECGISDKNNGHALAADRIVEGFARKLNLGSAEMALLPLGLIQAVARELFQESSRALRNNGLS